MDVLAACPAMAGGQGPCSKREEVECVEGSVAASMPPHGPAIGEDTAPESLLVALLKAMKTDHLDWSLPAHRRGTLRGMDAA
ncbi:hypothetical protein LMG31886_25160 [Xanthomonas hydrangeae]|uniref:hypothetical protein n=1 Tax=Xanthomonas hydrangeae TaxID=2775159 RepID=UPI00196454EA|nr:hypothetical protein LMG31884_25910 [Xanthomonas hydrangeae]CAD7717490.1 hypothetical protein LMG31884_25910 [Xanthomonas hydrangeae]CAD7734118.1 hypothetical protein LMG31887_25790 [Xanthomonas hydrangeae]CAD7734121.1 hypothetical protein LMG31887_25790 [Xanthomonas hydrangeae]CAD7736996.1 hypothetical protein LMG31886_25160 [Xanthomonas hydrangeae]